MSGEAKNPTSVFQKRRRVSIAPWWGGALLLLACACSPMVETRGHIRPEGAFDAIKPNVTTREEVTASLGSPSSTSSFGEESWYYISSRKEARAFLEPEIVEQQVTRIVFDENGVVKTVDTVDKSAGRDINFVEKTTPTEGHSLGFMEQVMGNLGRFNKPKDKIKKGP